ncbi:hypothetical protein CRUP_022682 [Coryphaenoides rupestris]|nr:hypothetical protein CRUP_022682 [Coryphaenoides rupestris]
MIKHQATTCRERYGLYSQINQRLQTMPRLPVSMVTGKKTTDESPVFQLLCTTIQNEALSVHKNTDTGVTQDAISRLAEVEGRQAQLGGCDPLEGHSELPVHPLGLQVTVQHQEAPTLRRPLQAGVLCKREGPRTRHLWCRSQSHCSR